MRTIIILTILVILFSCVTKKQITGNIRPYKSFAQYGGDTLKYLDDNFADNKQKYVGKKIKVLLHDLEFLVLSCMNFNMSHDTISRKALAVTFCNYDEKVDRMVENLKIIFVYIYWEERVPLDELDRLDNGKPGIWTKKHQKYFGEKIVKDIKVVAFPEAEKRVRKRVTN